MIELEYGGVIVNLFLWLSAGWLKMLYDDAVNASQVEYALVHRIGKALESSRSPGASFW
jgi:hypothetical protein